MKPSEKPLVHDVDLASVRDETPKLLLPAHVSVLNGAEGAIPIEVLPPPDFEAQDNDYIEYLDYDDRKVSTPR